MTAKIVWLLDLDGVVNCTAPSWGEPPFKAHVTSLGMYEHLAQTWRIRWAPSLVRRILAVHAQPHVEVVWCSTWCLLDMTDEPEIRRVERVLRMPELRCAFRDVSDNTQAAVNAAKRKAVLEVLDSGADLIWTDDEIVPPLGDSFRDVVQEHGGNALLIRPKSNKGLSREDMSLIESFTQRI